MGVDISGVIECHSTFGFPPNPRTGWRYAIDLDQLYCDGGYDAFGLLFGVMNKAGFEPVAAERGIPADADQRTRGLSESVSPPSFSKSWISWNEIEAAKNRIEAAYNETEATTREDKIRAHMLRGDWDPVWVVMKTLAALHGGDNVRLVVWFDR